MYSYRVTKVDIFVNYQLNTRTYNYNYVIPSTNTSLSIDRACNNVGPRPTVRVKRIVYEHTNDRYPPKHGNTGPNTLQVYILYIIMDDINVDSVRKLVLGCVYVGPNALTKSLTF